MVEELKEEGKMEPPGLDAFNRRDENNTGKASFEQEEIRLKQEYLEEIKKNNKAYTFFEGLAPSYTKVSVHWVMSAKKEETRRRRLKILIESSEKGEKIPPLNYGNK